jgi:hypothetical protein
LAADAAGKQPRSGCAKPPSAARSFEVCGTSKLPKGSFCTQSVLPRMEQSFPKGKLQKDLSVFVRICCFGALIRGLQKLEAFLKKVLIVAV